MPKVKVHIANEFIYGLAQIHSEQLLQRIHKIIESLKDLPEVGSPNVRQSLIGLYGLNLRKIPVSTFDIVYHYENEIVDILALVYGPTVT